jgi:hypothetical protein
MPANFAVRLYYLDEDDNWMFHDFEELPVARPCVIVIHRNHAKARTSASDLIAAIRKLLDDLDAKVANAEASEGKWTEVDTDNANLLHVLVCDGTQPASQAPEIYQSVQASDRVWILPVIKHAFISSVTKLLDEELQKRNVAFWEDKIEELGLVVLARAGITCLDRKVFVSYRRSDTSPIADQLFDELSRRNFQVFLDRVSVEPGVDFQASLFEHLADKSMVVLLNSKEFPASHWTMEEIRFARQHRLSVLILRLPEAQEDLGGTASEVVQVATGEIDSVSVPGFENSQAQLKQPALKAIIDRIVWEHDLMLVGRIRNIRNCIIAAAKRRREIKYTASKYDSSIGLSVSSADAAVRQYVIYPSPYPPWVAELFDASIRIDPQDTSRIIIGHAASLLPLRVKQLDWIVDGRNVNYHDVGSLDGLFDKLVSG